MRPRWPRTSPSCARCRPAIAAQLDGWRAQMAALAHKYNHAATFLYLGRGIHYAIAREGALKLKEASYVHAEGYPAGELKHGPNALVSDRGAAGGAGHGGPRDWRPRCCATKRRVQLLQRHEGAGSEGHRRRQHGRRGSEELVSDCVAVQPAPEYLLPISRSGAAAILLLLHGAGARRGRGPAAQPLKGSGGAASGAVRRHTSNLATRAGHTKATAWIEYIDPGRCICAERSRLLSRATRSELRSLPAFCPWSPAGRTRPR